MKAGWKTLIVVGVVLVLLSGQVMAQPWGGGRGRGQGQFQRPGMGGPGPMAQAWGPQGNRGVGRGQGWFQGPGMRGAGPMAQQWGPQGNRGVGRAPRAGQFCRPMQGPRTGVRGGRMGVQRQGIRGPMDVRGQSMGGRMGMRGQGGGVPGMQNWGPQARPGRQQAFVPPVGDGRAAGPRRQDVGPARQGGAVPLERLFDRADADNDGALTRDELKAFRGTRQDGGQSPQ